jgi:hypothetical protein
MENRGWMGKRACKAVEQEENHEKGLMLVLDRKPDEKFQF